MRRSKAHLNDGQRVLLVEDLTTDGRSKVNFCKALREAGATVEHVLVFFFYDIYPEGTDNPQRSRRDAAFAGHLVGRAGGRQGERQVRRRQARGSRKIHA